MAFKSSWELLIKSYEKFKVFWYLVKNRKIKVDYQRGYGSKKYLTKKASQPRGNLVVKKKNWFQEKKHENYLKCKNDVKKLLGAFNQELWAI